MMKKYVIIFALLGAFSTNKAQVIVSDPAVQSSMAQNIENTLAQIEQFENQLTYMEKAAAKVEKVNSYVRDMAELQQILVMQKQSITNSMRIKSMISEFRTNDYKVNVLKNVNSSLQSISSTIIMLNKILTSGFFKMTDKERMDFIQEKKHDVYIAWLIIRKYTL